MNWARSAAVTTVNITVTPVNDLPVALDDSYVVDEGGRLVADDPDGLLTPSNTNDDAVTTNDFDAEGDAFSAVLVTAPAYATSFTLNPDGTFVYEHDGSETIEDAFQYRLIDVNGGESVVATVTLDYQPGQ